MKGVKHARSPRNGALRGFVVGRLAARRRNRNEAGGRDHDARRWRYAAPDVQVPRAREVIASQEGCA